MEFDRRPYKLKNAVFEFLCPLCGVERGISVHYKLTKSNYFQIVILSSVLLLIGFPFLGLGGLIFFPVVGMSFEFVRRAVYRKEIPCPHCGFDAVWYRKDVPKAKQLVHEFWDKNKEDNTPSQEISNT